MTLAEILREFFRQLNETDDFRKNSPVVAALRAEVLRAIVEIDEMQAARIAIESQTRPAWGSRDVTASAQKNSS